MSEIGRRALQSLKDALQVAIDRFDLLETDDEVLRAAINEIEVSGIEFNKDEDTIAALLKEVAALGSIDAVALMVVLGCPQDEVADALGTLVRRSPDVKEGAAFEGLVAIFEEWAEEEVAAGRMTKTVCPKTGANLYGSVEKKK